MYLLTFSLIYYCITKEFYYFNKHNALHFLKRKSDRTEKKRNNNKSVLIVVYGKISRYFQISKYIIHIILYLKFGLKKYFI